MWLLYAELATHVLGPSLPISLFQHIMIWGCMTTSGVVYMCRIEGKMDGQLYVEILEDHVFQTLEFYGLDSNNKLFNPCLWHCITQCCILIFNIMLHQKKFEQKHLGLVFCGLGPVKNWDWSVETGTGWLRLGLSLNWSQLLFTGLCTQNTVYKY